MLPARKTMGKTTELLCQHQARTPGPKVNAKALQLAGNCPSSKEMQHPLQDLHTPPHCSQVRADDASSPTPGFWVETEAESPCLPQNHSVHRKNGTPGQPGSVFAVSVCSHMQHLRSQGRAEGLFGECGLEQREQRQLVSPGQRGCTTHKLSEIVLSTEFMSS